MSQTRALNAVVAMLEDRPALFKELLRAPGSDVQDLVGIEQRLHQAINRYAATQVRLGLMKALHVLPPPDTDDPEDFYRGVRATEAVFEDLVTSLDTGRSA